MAFTRKNVAAAVAGTLSLAMLTGCPQTPTATQPSTPPASATPAPAGEATPAPAASATPAPDATGTGTATPEPAKPAPAASGKTVTVSGFVYNEKGATVNDATIKARSTDGSYNFETKTVNGAYVFNNVPEGVVVEYTATKAGFTSRSQTETFQQATTGTKNEVNFGRAGGTGGTGKGGAYFISDYPEVASVTPADESTNVDNASLTYKLTLSEPLTNDGKDRFWDAFRIVPDNDIALTGVTGVGNNLEAGENTNPTDGRIAAVASDTTKLYTYELKKNDSFLDSDTNLVRGAWNAEGTELTVTFNGALRTGEKEGGKYAAFLATDGRKIEDAQGNQLGTSRNSMTAYEATTGSQLRHLFNVFKSNDLVVTEKFEDDWAGLDVGFANWAQTHSTFSDFQLAKDEKAPVLQSVRANKRSDTNLRIELEFDEPMAAFGGNGQALYGSAELFAPLNYSFAFGESSGKTSGVKLEGKSSSAAYTNTTTTAGAGRYNSLEVFPKEAELQIVTSGTFATGTVVPSALLAATSPLGIEVSGSNPKMVYFWVGRGNSLVTGYKEIKARVAKVSDPAGNVISTSDADANVRTGSID